MNRTRTCLLAAGLLLVALPVYGQVPSGSWRVLPNAPVHVDRHEDVVFVSPTTGWVVNHTGEIFNTTNGGQTWTRQLLAKTRSGLEVLFRSVAFANERVGWAGTLTDSNVLYETRNGGQSWQDISNRISGAAMVGICALWAASDQVIYGTSVVLPKPGGPNIKVWSSGSFRSKAA